MLKYFKHFNLPFLGKKRNRYTKIIVLKRAVNINGEPILVNFCNYLVQFVSPVVHNIHKTLLYWVNWVCRNLASASCVRHFH